MTSGNIKSNPSSDISSSPSRLVTVVDVYDLAESINRDFEFVANKFGKDLIEPIVKKVICVLETLEAFAKNNDTDNSQMMDLQNTIEYLQREKIQRQHDKTILEKEVTDLEENYKKEIDELCRVITSLQSEVKNIKRQLSISQSVENCSRSLSPDQNVVPVCEEEFQMMVDLRSISIKQKEQIKDLQRDIDNYCCEVENLQNNIEKLIRQNKELLRKNLSLQKQGRLLVQERADLINRLHQTEKNCLQLRQMLHDTSQACKDLVEEQQRENEGTSPQFTLEELKEVLQEKTLLKARVLELEEQLEIYRGSSSNGSQTLDQELENISGVCVNENLKCDKFFFGTKPSVSNEDIKNDNLTTIFENVKEELNVKINSNEECLVYGPIDREPEEKLNPLKYERKNSGVRKFFRFFKEFNTSGGRSPRHTSIQVPNSLSILSISGGGKSSNEES